MRSRMTEVRRIGVGGRVVAALLVGAALAASCTSDGATTGDALTTEQATAQLIASCTSADQRLSQLPQPTDVAGQAVWAGDIGAVLDDQATSIRALVILDEEQRVDIRAFADNTAAQGAAWRALGGLLGPDQDLTDNPDIEELTTEIAELSLGRDDLSDDLGAPECRRG